MKRTGIHTNIRTDLLEKVEKIADIRKSDKNVIIEEMLERQFNNYKNYVFDRIGTILNKISIDVNSKETIEIGKTYISISEKELEVQNLIKEMLHISNKDDFFIHPISVIFSKLFMLEIAIGLITCNKSEYQNSTFSLKNISKYLMDLEKVESNLKILKNKNIKCFNSLINWLEDRLLGENKEFNSQIIRGVRIYLDNYLAANKLL